MWSVVSPGSGARASCRFVAFVTALVALANAASAQTTVTLSTPGTHISVDTTIRDGAYAANNYSTTDALVSKKAGGAGLNRRILVKVDTESYIPANAVIQSARLYLVLKSADSAEQRPLTAYRVTKSFTKTGASWHYFRDGEAWTTSGGDVDGSFGTTTVGGGPGTTYTFELTDLVQRSVNGEFGSRWTRVELIDTGSVSDGSYKAFHSTRAVTASLRPRLVVTYTSNATATPPPTTGTTLRVMQWNIKNARGSDGVCNPDRIASTILTQQAHVISLNEVKAYAGECSWTFDMSAKLESLLESKSGVAWYRSYVQISGKAGNVLLSRLPLVSSSTTLLSYSRGVAQVGVVVNGRTINLFSTHLEYYTASWRTTQINQALAWMRNFPEPRIMLGDFNTWPGTSDYTLMATPYQDSWTAGTSAGIATAFNGTGSTSGGSRFDYVFYSRVSALTLQAVQVPDTRINGVYPSDHHPVIATFRVN